MTLGYDEHELVNSLEGLPRDLKAAFAAACAERLLPAYVAFSTRTRRRDPSSLGIVLRSLWGDLEGHRMTETDLQEKLDACMELHPRDDEVPWVMEQGLAEDPVAATAYALRCRQNGESQEAGWAARRAFEALYYFVTERENLDWSAGGPEERARTEARILEHPLVQAELARQQRDLNDLLHAGAKDQRRATMRLRDRARAEASAVFGADL